LAKKCYNFLVMWQAKTLTVCLVICLFCLSKVSAQQESLGANPPHQFGNPNAKYKLEIFVDFQCPTCAAFNKKLDAWKARYPNDILIVFRHFPLAIPAHDKAFLAAKVAESAGKQGKFWEMYNLLLLNQQKWGTSSLAENMFVNYAKKLRLNVEVFKADLQSEEITERINLDLAKARFLKLSSTPTVFLNDKELRFEEALNLVEIISKDNK
jgi:protein-disulfide isomerase